VANPSVVVDFIANTNQLVQGIKGVANASDQAAGSVRKVNWKSLLKWGAAGAGLAVATKFVKDATGATEDLAKQTLALSRVTGMDTQTASEWVSVLKSRNIDAATFGKSMTILSKQMIGATDGSKKSVSAFEQLGVSMADVRAGNTQAVLMQVADGFKSMTNPAQRAALTQQLFGRAAAKLTPLLYAGSDAIQEQLDMTEKYGATISGKTVAGVKSMAADQREMGIAMEGVKIQLGSALIPALASLSQILTSIVGVMQPLIANATVMKAVLIVLTVAVVAYKVAMIAAAIATTVFETAAAPVALVALGIVAAIAALIVVGYLLYKHWDELAALAGTVWSAIQSAASAALDWLAANWPLIVGILAGPIALAVALIATHWQTIINGVNTAWTTIKSVISSVLSAISAAIASGFNAITSAITGAMSAIQSAVSSAWNVIKGVVTGAMSAISGTVTATWNALLSFFGALGARIGSAFAAVRTWLAKPGEWASDAVAAAESAFNGLIGFLSNLAGRVGAVMSSVANAMRAPINAVIGAWNSLSFTVPPVTIPGFEGVKVAGKTIVPGWGGTSIGGFTIGFPNIPKLATGGVFNAPTLAMVGEGAGREIVAPESLLRSILSEVTPSVRVYIGETELRGLVRTEVRQEDNRTAAALIGGLA
jgi:hypothetical protein